MNRRGGTKTLYHGKVVGQVSSGEALMGFWFLVSGFWLLVAGFWFLVMTHRGSFVFGGRTFVGD
jgi:hypothetical protein